MHHSEQIKAYLLWLQERGIRFPALAPPSARGLDSHQVSASPVSAPIKVLFLADIPTPGSEGHWKPLNGEEEALLDRMIQAMHMASHDAVVTPAFPPTVNPDVPPDDDLITTQRTRLQDLLHALKPELIIALGWQATRVALGEDCSWNSVRGQITASDHLAGVIVLPTLHPRDLLRFPGNKRSTWADLQRGMGQLGLGAKVQIS